MENKKLLQVCELWDCDCEPLTNVKVGSKTHNYCCMKGFEKSLKDFTEHLKGIQKINHN